jgi:hypothetical protein
MNAIGQNCHLQRLGSGRVVVTSANTGFWMVDGLYEGHAPFQVIRSVNQPDRVIVPLPSEITDIVRPVGPPPSPVLTDFYYFTGFDYEYKETVDGVADPDWKTSSFGGTPYMIDSGWQNGGQEGSMFITVVTGDGINVLKINDWWFHKLASEKPSGWVPGDDLGPGPPWFNGAGTYRISFDVVELLSTAVGSGASWELVDSESTETIDFEITVNEDATIVNTGMMTSGGALSYDASFSSYTIDRTWEATDTVVILEPGGTRNRYNFQNLRFEAV